MYLVRKLSKDGRVEVYDLYPFELNSHGTLRPRKPKVWRFHKGIAAIDEHVGACMLAIELREKGSETLDA